MHYEGRSYTGLMRHLMLALVVLGFVATQTERLRGEKSTGDSGAGMPGVKRALRGGVSSSPEDFPNSACPRGPLLSPATERASNKIPQEAAA